MINFFTFASIRDNVSPSVGNPLGGLTENGKGK